MKKTILPFLAATLLLTACGGPSGEDKLVAAFTAYGCSSHELVMEVTEDMSKMADMVSKRREIQKQLDEDLSSAFKTDADAQKALEGSDKDALKAKLESSLQAKCNAPQEVVDGVWSEFEEMM